LLFRVTYSDGSVVECGSRSWAETAEKAASELRVILAAGAVSQELVAVLPWTDEHYTLTIAEVFATLEASS
jgi:hypothetical protein